MFNNINNAKDLIALIIFILLLFFTFLLISCSESPTDPPDVIEDPSSLEVVLPEDVGYSSAKLDAVKQLAKNSSFDAMMVLYDGKVFFSWGKVTENYNLHSIRKPLLSSLYGIHAAEGNINLDATLEELNIDDIPPILTADEKQAKVRDLIKSRSGVYHVAAAELDGIGWTESRPERGSHPPNTFFYYNNWDFNAAGTIFRQVTGKDIYEEFKTRIGNPIGMQDFDIANCNYQYEYDKSIHPAYHFKISCRDLARFGLLYQKNGNWKGQQLIPSQWISESTNAFSIEDSTLGIGYGYMWRIYLGGTEFSQNWGGHKIFGHTGLAGEQSLMIIPELKLVIVQRTDTDKQYTSTDNGFELAMRIVNAKL
jgi:CubicO group peptidase (beta-lactamase class C family)